MVKGHVEASIGIIKHLPSLDYVIPAVTGHHERYDGGGYPWGIAGENIPPSPPESSVWRIPSTPWSPSAATSSGIPLKRVMEILREEAGKQFDPRLVEAFLPAGQRQGQGCGGRVQPEGPPPPVTSPSKIEKRRSAPVPKKGLSANCTYHAGAVPPHLFQLSPTRSKVSRADSASAAGAAQSIPSTPNRRASSTTPGSRNTTSRDRESTAAFHRLSNGLQENAAGFLDTAQQDSSQENAEAEAGKLVVELAFIPEKRHKRLGAGLEQQHRQAPPPPNWPRGSGCTSPDPLKLRAP